MHGEVKTSPGTTKERSYRRFISGTLEIMRKHKNWHSSNKPVKKKEEAIVPRNSEKLTTMPKILESSKTT